LTVTQLLGTLKRLIHGGIMTVDLRFEALKAAPLDSWIALSEDETKIVATASTYEEAVQKSESAGVSDPVLVKTPKAWHAIAV
jgi:hypothetical protein